MKLYKQSYNLKDIYSRYDCQAHNISDWLIEETKKLLYQEHNKQGRVHDISLDDIGNDRYCVITLEIL